MPTTSEVDTRLRDLGLKMAEAMDDFDRKPLTRESVGEVFVEMAGYLGYVCGVLRGHHAILMSLAGKTGIVEVPK